MSAILDVVMAGLVPAIHVFCRICRKAWMPGHRRSERTPFFERPRPGMTVMAGMVLVTAASAHDVAVGPNGGRVVDAGARHVELVVKDRTVTVFVTDATHKPVPLTGFKGVAVLNADGKAHRIVLEPQGERLVGTAPAALRAPKGVVQATAPDGTVLQAQFK